MYEVIGGGFRCGVRVVGCVGCVFGEYVGCVECVIDFVS